MRILTLLVFTFTAAAAMSQNPGYLGRKNMVDINISGQVPFWPNWKEDNTENSYSNYYLSTTDNDRFDIGFHIGAIHAFSRKFAMGLEVGKDFFSVKIPSLSKYNLAGNDTWVDVGGRIDRLPVQVFTIMPKFEFSAKGGLLPIGISHQLGFGIRTYTIQEKTLNYNLYYQDANYDNIALNETQKADLNSNLVNYNQKYKGYSLFYALCLRTPVGHSLVVNYGVRYQLNIIPFGSTNYLHDTNNEYWTKPTAIHEAIRERNRFSFIWLFFGFSWAF